VAKNLFYGGKKRGKRNHKGVKKIQKHNANHDSFSTAINCADFVLKIPDEKHYTHAINDNKRRVIEPIFMV